ncbi:unnamed protein product, partial [Iphiclides podalirius]
MLIEYDKIRTPLGTVSQTVADWSHYFALENSQGWHKVWDALGLDMGQVATDRRSICLERAPLSIRKQGAASLSTPPVITRR